MGTHKIWDSSLIFIGPSKCSYVCMHEHTQILHARWAEERQCAPNPTLKKVSSALVLIHEKDACSCVHPCVYQLTPISGEGEWRRWDMGEDEPRLCEKQERRRRGGEKEKGNGEASGGIEWKK